jgi:hypothetical protein
MLYQSNLRSARNSVLPIVHDAMMPTILCKNFVGSSSLYCSSMVFTVQTYGADGRVVRSQSSLQRQL